MFRKASSTTMNYPSLARDYRSMRRVAVIGFVAAALTLTGCTATPTPEEGDDGSIALPDYYPADYQDIVEGSRDESGQLNIYSVLDPENWAPIIEGFNERYPWIEIAANDLGSGEVFERYYNEDGAGQASADLLVSGSVFHWADMVDEGGRLLDYDSPESTKVPKWSHPSTGLYTFLTSPVVAAYNTALVSGDVEPTSLTAIAELAASDPAKYAGKVLSYDVAASPYGLAINMAYVERSSDASNKLDDVLPYVQSVSNPSMEMLISGEYLTSYFVSRFQAEQAKQTSGGLLDWAWLEDGTPITLYGMGITEGTQNPNSAKLFLDYILSVDGQAIIAGQGFVPYRDDMPAEITPTIKTLTDDLGEENVFVVGYEKPATDDVDTFIARWTAAKSD